MKKITYALLISLLWLFSLNSQAAQVTGIYSATTLVADTSEAARNLAAQQLLQEVLVRASGTERVLVHLPPADFNQKPEDYAQHPKFKLWQDLSQAANFITQYSYSKTNQFLVQDGRSSPAQNLQLTFDEVSVKRLLQDMHAPIWDSNRPEVLVWLAIESNNGQSLIIPATNSALAEVIQQQSSKRGLPHKFPSQSSIQNMFQPVWNHDEELLVKRSLPYKTDAIVIGKVWPLGQKWQVSWEMYLGAENVTANSSAATLRQALVEGINFVTEELSLRYASQADQASGTYTLAITEINHVHAYAALNDYLQGLSLTKNLKLLESSAAGMLYEVQLTGGLEQLKANLRLDGRLVEHHEQRQQSTSQQPAASLNKSLDLPFADAYFLWQEN